MKEEILKIVNDIRVAKGLSIVSELKETDKLRDDLGLTSFDLAELTVKIEDIYDIDIFADGLVNNIGEIYAKLQN